MILNSSNSGSCSRVELKLDKMTFDQNFELFNDQFTNNFNDTSDLLELLDFFADEENDQNTIFLSRSKFILFVNCIYP